VLACLAGVELARALPRAAAPAAPVIVERELLAMGTALRIGVAGDDREAALRASEAAVQAIASAEARLSTWRADSELARLNAAPAGQPLLLSAETAAELGAAMRCGRATGGAFAVAAGRLVDLWDLRGAGRIPEAGELADALPASTPDAWRLGDGRAVRRHPDVRLEEGGFGKGAGLDRAVAALRAAPGLTAAWLDLGGQTAFVGAGPWAVRVADPGQRQRPVVELLLDGGSLSTSGNGQRARRVAGRTLGHLLDPRTGRPAEDFGSLSVWAASALVADCLSTGLYVLGPDAALAFAAEHPGVEVLALVRGPGGLEARASAGLAGRVRALDPTLEIDVRRSPAAPSSAGTRAGATGRFLSEGGPAAP
jgi:thiamine biosynthesis lipoprotein